MGIAEVVDHDQSDRAPDNASPRLADCPGRRFRFGKFSLTRIKAMS